MRALKYLIIGLLIVSVTKKTYLSDNNHNLPFKLTLSTKDAQAAINALDKQESPSMIGSYDPITQTATITFTNVVEYNKSVTPPNIMNRKLKLFGSLPTPHQQNTDKKGTIMRPGGIRPVTSLYGIVQTELDQELATTASTPSKSNIEYYDRSPKTALLKNGTTYVGIVEYNQPTTPPNISNPMLKLFATIPTANYQPSSLYGSVQPTTTLYGFPVSGEKFLVKSESTTIGYYWPENKIVQLNNGDTFVCIIQEKQGHYKKIGYHALGPVYTWFSGTDLEAYGILKESPNFKQRVERIGTVKLDHSTTVSLYGVLMNEKTLFATPTTLPSNILSEQLKSFNMYEQPTSSRQQANIMVNSMANSINKATDFSIS